MAKINKPAGFWWRLLSRLIDVIIVIIVMSITIYFVIEKTNGVYHFKEDAYYYMWTAISAFVMLLVTTLIPFMTKGRSIGNFITRTKVVSDDSIYLSVAYRELFFGIAWTTLVILFMVVLTPRIFTGVITNNDAKIQLSIIDQFRFAIVNTVSGVAIFVQFIFTISIMVKKGGNSMIDRLSRSNVIKTNKFITTNKKEKKIIIEPRLVDNQPVNWVEGD